MLYKFLGKPDRTFPHLKTGEVYDLEIEEERVGFFESVGGWLMGITKPIIVSGISWFNCPYSSWRMFYKNWQQV